MKKQQKNARKIVKPPKKTIIEIREQFKTIFDNSNDIISYIDRRGKIVDINKRINDILGYKPKEIIGKNFTQIGIIPLKDLANMLKLFEDTIIKGRIMPNFEIKLKHKNGRKIFIMEVGTSFIKKNGQVEGVVSIYRDITRQKRIEENLQKALKKVKEVAKLKDDFLNTTSHELKTPLIPITSQTELLLDGDYGRLNKKQAQAIKMIARNTDRLTRLVNDILDITKIKSKKLQLILENADLSKIIADSVEDFKNLADQKQIELKSKLLTKSLKLLIDQARICQVMANCLDNAIKFTPGKGLIEVEMKKVKDNLVVSIKDTGIGISKRYLRKIFIPFFRVESDITRKFGGTGLGLAICKGIINIHHGKIWAKSLGKGKGTTLTFTLPLKTKKQ
ncbi:PAS domain S-box protein [Patescibacteria group bacterium]|nr:PAS domain S-box protein [Patescibacteria group bacterium]